jgi:hypothetical protein
VIAIVLAFTCEFWHWDGTAVVEGVNVRAGEWPIFAAEHRHIVSL